MNLPTWSWYVIGAGIFILAYMFFIGKQYKTTGSGNNIIQLPMTSDLQNYNGAVDVVTQILSQQQSELQQLHGSPHGGG